jgi:RNA polymerase sigma factor (sigma-70 family)
MNRLLCLVREHLAALGGETDRELLEDFLSTRDEAAFAELVRRHGPLVWGACRRRLNHIQDAEDAFQATFLVLIRRAASIAPGTPLGPWLHKVAAMTARNVLRQHRRRASISGPMEHEVAATCTDPDHRLDLDAALLELPERERVPIVLCHLQGLSRREAAERLECPEGTLSARLHRALARLRARLGDRKLAALGVAGTAALPADLVAATVRSAVIFTTSTSTAVGVSPAVAGLTDGVLRMFWMKKLVAGSVAAILVAGGLLAGVAARFDGVARAEEPSATEPQAAPEDPDAVVKRIEKRIDELRKQKELLGAMEMELFAEKEKLETAKRVKAEAAAVAELEGAVAITVGRNPSGYSYSVREVVKGRVAEIHTSDIDILTTYLSRAFRDPKGPKSVRVAADKDHPYDGLRQVFAACAAAGYAKATFSHTTQAHLNYLNVAGVFDGSTITTGALLRNSIPSQRTFDLYTYGNLNLHGWNTANRIETAPNPGEIDLTKYAPKKP